MENRIFIAISNELWRPMLYAVARDYHPTTIQMGHGVQIVTYSLKEEQARQAAMGTLSLPNGLRRVKFSFRGKIPLIERGKAIVRIAFVPNNNWPDESDDRIYLSGEESKTLGMDLGEVSRGSFRSFSWILQELFPCESATNVIEGHWEAEQKAKKPLPLKNPIYTEALGHVAMCKREVCKRFMKDYQGVFLAKAKKAFEAFDV